MNSRSPFDVLPEPPGAAAIARWLAALPRRLGIVRHWRWWLIGSMLAVVALAMLRAPLGAWLWPETRAQVLRGEAEQALAEGRLTAPDGSGARELFEAALAMDPDRAEVRAGLARVALAALERAREALAQDRFGEARRHLALARALSVPRAQADAVDAELRRREAGGAGVDDLFALAGRAHAEGRLDAGDDDALPLYARVLVLDPAHAGALRGREDALAELLAQARESLRAGDTLEAARLVARVRTYDAGHVDLPDTLARLMEEAGPGAADIERVLAGEAPMSARAAGTAAVPVAPEPLDARARASRVAGLLEEAAVAESAGRLLEPADPGVGSGAGPGAVDRIAAARALDPASPDVAAAVARLLPGLRDCHERELRANRLRSASDCLDARAALGDDAGELAADYRQLAERWLAIGDERLGAGDVAEARRALAAARRVDPGAPGLADFEQRVRAAAAAMRFD